MGEFFPVRRRIDFPGAEKRNNVNPSSQVRTYKIQGAGSISKILLQKELNHAGREDIAWNDDNRLDLLILQCISHSVRSPVNGNELKETGDETQMLLQRESRYANLT